MEEDEKVEFEQAKFYLTKIIDIAEKTGNDLTTHPTGFAYRQQKVALDKEMVKFNLDFFNKKIDKTIADFESAGNADAAEKAKGIKKQVNEQGVDTLYTGDVIDFEPDLASTAAVLTHMKEQHEEAQQALVEMVAPGKTLASNEPYQITATEAEDKAMQNALKKLGEDTKSLNVSNGEYGFDIVKPKANAITKKELDSKLAGFKPTPEQAEKLDGLMDEPHAEFFNDFQTEMRDRALVATGGKALGTLPEAVKGKLPYSNVTDSEQLGDPSKIILRKLSTDDEETAKEESTFGKVDEVDGDAAVEEDDYVEAKQPYTWDDSPYIKDADPQSEPHYYPGGHWNHVYNVELPENEDFEAASLRNSMMVNYERFTIGIPDIDNELLHDDGTDVIREDDGLPITDERDGYPIPLSKVKEQLYATLEEYTEQYKKWEKCNSIQDLLDSFEVPLDDIITTKKAATA